MKTIIVILLTIVSIVQATQETINQAINPHVYCVILAGGSGERIWPISRQHKPKQFISLDGEKTFLEQTIDRIEKIVLLDNIWVCAAEDHVAQIQDAVGNRIGNIVVEPVARNTGPAVLLSCLQLQSVDPDAVVIFLPADAYIPVEETEKFTSSLSKAINFIQQYDHLAVFGLKPNYPATGYGYIEFNQDDLLHELASVTKFHEKPSDEQARTYVSTGLLWNLGMFCGRNSVFIDEFKKWAPDIFQQVRYYLDGQEHYGIVRKISIDYAVIEKSDNVWVLPAYFTWYDIGNIAVFLELKAQHGLLTDKITSINAFNNLVDVPDRLVALIGIDNLCVVQTDDVLLIAQKSEVGRIKELIGFLKKEKWYEYL
ncbi:MAG TPA: hypothetical protein ENI08_02555 [Candidatus Dependentiae bacterium]|nr:hypothetical protein [Candidatus Dependentiae bacterium]